VYLPKFYKKPFENSIKNLFTKKEFIKNSQKQPKLNIFNNKIPLNIFKNPIKISNNLTYLHNNISS